MHIRTISEALFGGIGEIMILSSAILLGLVILQSSLKGYFTWIIIFVLMFFGILLRKFGNGILEDLRSGKIFKRFGLVTK